MLLLPTCELPKRIDFLGFHEWLEDDLYWLSSSSCEITTRLRRKAQLIHQSPSARLRSLSASATTECLTTQFYLCTNDLLQFSFVEGIHRFHDLLWFLCEAYCASDFSRDWLDHYAVYAFTIDQLLVNEPMRQTHDVPRHIVRRSNLALLAKLQLGDECSWREVCLHTTPNQPIDEILEITIAALSWREQKPSDAVMMDLLNQWLEPEIVSAQGRKNLSERLARLVEPFRSLDPNTQQRAHARLRTWFAQLHQKTLLAVYDTLIANVEARNHSSALPTL